MTQALPSILALDLATRTGWAVRLAGAATHYNHGFLDLGADGAKDRAAKGERLMKHMRQLIDAYQVKTVVIEQPIFIQSNFDSARLAHGLFMVAELIARGRGCRVYEVNAMTLKKAWTGSGKADKPRMIEVARANGFDIKDDNEADALALAHYAARQMGSGAMPGQLV